MAIWGRCCRSADAMKLDGKTQAALARSLSTLPPDEQGWITFAEARSLFSTKGDQYAFGDGQGQQKETSVVRGAAPIRRQLHAGRRAGLLRAQTGRGSKSESVGCAIGNLFHRASTATFLETNFNKTR